SRARKVVLRLTAASGKGRPRQYPDDHLVRVASIYRQAWEAHRPPTKAVAENLHLSHSAAAKWVAKAREAGLLAPTERGRAGGILLLSAAGAAISSGSAVITKGKPTRRTKRETR